MAKKKQQTEINIPDCQHCPHLEECLPFNNTKFENKNCIFTTVKI